MVVKDILGGNSFYMLNKKIVSGLGIESALMLAIVVDATDVFDNNWVYQTMETINKLSYGFLTRFKQDVAIKKLKEVGILEQKNMGMPRKRYFRINEIKLLEFLREMNQNQAD